MRQSGVSRAPFLLCLIAMTFALSTEASAAQCKVTTNDWDEGFGRLLLGEDIKSDRAKLLKPCVSAGQCALMDESGIEYSSDKTNTVVSKGLDLDGYVGKMPFGIDRSDNVEHVTKKLSSQPGVVEQTLRGPDGVLLLSEACFTNSKNILFSVIVAFSADQKMIGVGIATKNEYHRMRELMKAFPLSK